MNTSLHYRIIIVIVIAIQLTDLPATANGNTAEQNQSKTIRDKAYTRLKALSNKIREPEVFFSFPKTNRQLIISIA